MIHKLLEKWHRLVNDNDVKGLGSVLSDDAIFHSPVVHTPQIGKEITEKYLAAAFNVLFNDTFEYVREIVGEREAMLEFVVELDGIVVNGVDIITWNENGRIVDFKVMIRPSKAINVVRDRMVKELQSR
jgi:SnoaL-like domain